MSTIKVTDEDFEDKTTNGLVVVDFWAEWCGPCRTIGPILEELSKEYAGKVMVCKMNVDDSHNTAGSFNIRSIPTMIAFKDGVKIDTKVGGMPKPAIKKWFDDLISNNPS